MSAHIAGIPAREFLQLQARAMTDEAAVQRRLLAKVVVEPSGCWRFTGALTKGPGRSAGYGQFKYLGRFMQAHRAAYLMFVGEIPAGLQIDHLCRNRSCVNPKHLEPVTVRENVLRGDTIPAANAAKTHCHRGHEFTDVNTYVTPTGKRDCRTCRSAAEAAYRVRRRAGRAA